MSAFWILIFVSFFASNSLDKAKSVKVKLEETPLKTFDEIFGEGWCDKGEAEDLKILAPTNFGQNAHHQIDRQNTQIGQIKPNSTDQLGQFKSNSTDQNPPLTESDHSGQIEPNSTDQNAPLTEPDHSGQIEPNSTDQNAPLTESDHSGQIESNSTDQNHPLTESDHTDKAKTIEIIVEDEQKRNIVVKFHEIKDEFKQKGKYSKKEWVQIEEKIAKYLNVYRTKIYEWKKELGISGKVFNENEQKNLIEKFDQMKAELMRAGFKNSYHHQIDETVAKKLGLSFKTIYNWKQKFGQTAPNNYPHSEQKELMKHYFEIKDQNPKFRDEDIAKMLKIGSATLFRWKKQFKPNSNSGTI